MNRKTIPLALKERQKNQREETISAIKEAIDIITADGGIVSKDFQMPYPEFE